MDPNMNNLLKWSIENSTLPGSDPASASASGNGNGNGNGSGDSSPPPPRALNPEVLAALFGGPSDADLMKASMAAVQDVTVPLADRLVAFDNLEQLLESIDNANNMASLGLWSPLVGLLDSAEPELRRMAAWCVGTAVQNNPTSQERALVLGALPRLVRMATAPDEDEGVRRKACYAISSEARNYQPGVNAVLDAVTEASRAELGALDASDMDHVDRLMAVLRRP